MLPEQHPQALLTVKGLKISFPTPKGRKAAVDGISFSVHKGETLALVGESGCGKSMTALSLMGLLPSPPACIEAGEILFEGQDLLRLGPAALRQVRGREIGMIFQEPMTSLNPVFSVGDQIAEVFRIHQKLSRKEAYDRAVHMLQLVNIPAPSKRAEEYPHQLSGGMRQRVMIAMALACEPKLLIADEPTTALDVTIQAQILDLMATLQEQLGMAILLITHDLGVVAEVCDSVLVMYAGQLVEKAKTSELFRRPCHPYTAGLLRSLPRLGQKVARLPSIAGTVPSLSEQPLGCRFHVRCPEVLPRCKSEQPSPLLTSAGGQVACWLRESSQGRSSG